MSDSDQIAPFDHSAVVDIEQEMKRSYLDYAMSVIVGRALPDVRDGLKPVHRRVLYGMWESGNNSNKPYKKSARIVGDVMGKYHPHGDSAIYDTVVRMAQDFSLRYPMVDGQGNFGSIDGDSAAAMRYTEVRLTKLAEEMLREDIDKETVDWTINYDGSMQEPLVLPARIPNLLVNGGTGIAVGMATNIPPHNLTEVINAVQVLIENPDATVEELMQCLPGPDFPTSGYIHGREGILSAYRTGRGTIQVRAKAGIETRRNDKQSIIITELPYQVNKARLCERMGELIRDKKVEGITDLRDESGREGIRIVLDVKRGEIPEVILNRLYKLTQMQTTFGIILLAIVENQPQVLTLPEILKHFLNHRKTVVVRRTRYNLRKAEERAHLLEGILKALDHLDQIIATIRSSRTPPEARERLVSDFALTVVQAQAILEMRLQRLTGLERDKVIEEFEELAKLIDGYRKLLGSDELLLAAISTELQEIKETYGDERRTEIISQTTEITVEDMIADEDMVITVTQSGYVKRSPLALYRAQNRGGKGRMGMVTKEGDFVEHLYVASAHSYVLCFTERGRVHWLKVHEIPQLGPAARGKALVNLVQLEQGDRVMTTVSVRQFDEDRYLIFGTVNGTIKKTPLSAYSHPRAGGIIAINIDEGDALLNVRAVEPDQDILLATADGYSIRFGEGDARPMGRATRGVRGIALRKGDRVVAVEILDPRGEILTVSEYGYGKRTAVEDYRRQGRGGKGIINLKVAKKTGRVVGVKQVSEKDGLLLITHEGKIIRIKVEGVRVIGRSTQGVKLMDLEGKDCLMSVAKLVERDDDEELSAEDAAAQAGAEQTAEASEDQAKSEGQPDDEGEVN